MSIVRHSTGSPFGEPDSSRWNPEGNPPWIPIVNRRSSMKGPNNNINTSRTRDVENQLSGKTIRFGANESNSFNEDDPPERIHYPRVIHDTNKSELPKMVRSPTQSDLQDNTFISISAAPRTVRELDTSSPTLNEYLKHISTNDKNETERRNEAFSKGEYFPSGGRRTKRTKRTQRRKTWSVSFSRKKRKGTKRKGTKRKGTKRKTRRLHR